MLSLFTVAVSVQQTVVGKGGHLCREKAKTEKQDEGRSRSAQDRQHLE